MEAGCGTSESCRLCGAVAAILAAQKGCADVRECQIARPDGEAMDLRVKASPFDCDGRRYTILTLRDIADENRRQVLERTFFHDILNSAGGMKGIADILSEGASMEDLEEFGPLLSSTAELLVHEIQAQRDLLAAEQGRLVIDREPLGSLRVIQDVVGLYRNHPVGEDRAIEIDSGVAEVEFTTSRPLLMRVLGNMLKNALEASQAGDTVRLGCRNGDSGIRFWVWNAGVIPGDVQKQLFKRSFSTKGTGRGVGTYSMMLLGEKYLDGKVGFTSREGEGTTFEIVLP
jgi:signal transduction histidine kinase